MKFFGTSARAALLLFFCSPLLAQQVEKSPEFSADSTELIAEHTRYQWISLTSDEAKKIAVAELIITNLKSADRDFAMNVYGTVLKDTNGKEHMFHSIAMGRVTIKLEDRQNYLRYLLQRDKPVKLQVTFPFSAELSSVREMALVAESGTEAGRFDTIRLKKPNQKNNRESD